MKAAVFIGIGFQDCAWEGAGVVSDGEEPVVHSDKGLGVEI